VGAAATDENFNRDVDGEGTGRDTVRYEIDVTGLEGTVTVRTELLFQTVVPAFADHLRQHQTPAIDRFGRQYDTAEKRPVTIQSAELEVPLAPGEDALFRRGDANTDGTQDLSDAVFVLLYLFKSGAAPPCLKSADVDAGGAVDIADPVAMLQYLFLGASAPPPPFSACGTGSAGGDLSCLSFPPCE
jgi:hypothetical protein